MGLHANMRAEPVADLHLREALLVQPNETVRQAVLKMREKQVGCVYIVDEERMPMGIFTEHLLNRFLLEGASLDDPLEKHMVRSQTTVALTDPIIDVVAAIQSDDKRFVCVLDDRGRVSSLTGQKGLMEYIADHFPGQVMVQRVGCTPYVQEREGA